MSESYSANRITYPKLISKNLNQPIFFIAEAGTGHGGNLEIAKTMVDVCVANQVGAIKFQHVIAEEILHPLCGKIELASKKIDLFEYFLAIEKKTDINFWRRIKDYCDEQGILFLCSFFGSKSFNDLKNIGVEAYKIASPEMNYYHLWNHLKSLHKPVFFSSGVSKSADIEHLFNYFKQVNFDLSCLIHFHCVTQYPAPVESYNLLYAHTFEKHYQVLTGLSDHSNGLLVPLVFTALKAIKKLPVVFEKHFTLSSLQHNIDDPVAVNESELQELIPAMKEVYEACRKHTNLNFDTETDLKGFVQEFTEVILQLSKQKKCKNIFANKKIFVPQTLVRSIMALLGSGIKSLSASEQIDYPTTKRSLLAIRSINAGEKITPDNAAYLRSEKNLNPGMDYRYEEVVWGGTARVNIKNAEAITENNVLFQ